MPRELRYRQALNVGAQLNVLANRWGCRLYWQVLFPIMGAAF